MTIIHLQSGTSSSLKKQQEGTNTELGYFQQLLRELKRLAKNKGRRATQPEIADLVRSALFGISTSSVENLLAEASQLAYKIEGKTADDRFFKSLSELAKTRVKKLEEETINLTETIEAVAC